MAVKRLALAAATLVIGVGAPVGAIAASTPTFRMSIVHYVRGCHVWRVTGLRGAKTTVTVKHGTRVQIRQEGRHVQRPAARDEGLSHPAGTGS